MKDNKVIIVLAIILGVIVLTIIGSVVGQYLDELKWEKEKKESYNEIEYTIPESFIEMDKDKSEISPEFYYRDDNTYCYFDISSFDKYEDKDWWFNSLVYTTLNDVVGEKEEIIINNNPALYVTVKDTNSMKYYYGFESTNHLYSVRFVSYDYTKGDTPGIEDSPCYTAKDSIIESIKLK